MKRNKSFAKDTKVIYLVATPIGNLGEFSSRAIEVIKVADIVGAEDTRNANNLFKKFNLNKRIISLREHNEVEASEYLISEVKNGKKVAYVSDAGYPGISDPGSILVKKAIENDIAVSVVSGGCAFINALVSSGLPTDHFYFHGFISPKESEATKELEALKDKKETLVFYEAPHRVIDTLKIMNKVLGNREASLQRELTKLNEEKIYATLEELSNIDPSTLKGEMVIVISGNSSNEEYDKKNIINKVNYFINKGMSKKDAIETVADIFHIKKNKIKELFL